MDAVDDRQLTLMIFTAEPKPGTYTKDKLEVLLSGSPTGDTKRPEMWGYKFPGNASGDLKLEITKFEMAGPAKAILSGRLQGKLTKVLGKGEMTLENGTFENLEVQVFNEMYLNKP
jgi:hypothetical protein